MTKKKRTILFFFLLFVLILTIPAVILYNQGYRLDLTNRKLAQTGGFFFKTSPKQSEIHINGKLIKKTDFFFGSVLIENLLPQKYKVEVKRNSYLTWEKNLEVKEKMVTEVKSIVLFPEKINFTILRKGVKQFWFSPDLKKIILKEEDKNGWSLKLYEPDRNITSHLISQAELSPKKPILTSLEFSDNSREITLEAEILDNLKYFTLDIGQIPPILNEIPTPFLTLQDAVTYQKFQNDVYYLDKSGYVFKSDKSLTQKEKINSSAWPIKQETEYKLIILPNNNLFLKENNNIYYFNQSSKSFEKFSENTNNLKISPDSKKVAYFSDYEISVFFLKDSDPKKKAGDRVFINRFSEKIKDIFWVNSDYLTFNAGNEVKISEIDDRDRINISDITGLMKNPVIFWNQYDKKLYVLSEDNLYQSEKIID